MWQLCLKCQSAGKLTLNYADRLFLFAYASVKRDFLLNGHRHAHSVPQ